MGRTVTRPFCIGFARLVAVLAYAAAVFDMTFGQSFSCGVGPGGLYPWNTKWQTACYFATHDPTASVLSVALVAVGTALIFISIFSE